MPFPTPIDPPPLFKRSGEFSRFSLLSAIASDTLDPHAWSSDGVTWGEVSACPAVSGNTFDGALCGDQFIKTAPTSIYGPERSAVPAWFEHAVWVGAQCRTADLEAEARYQFNAPFELDVEALYTADLLATDPPTDLGGPFPVLCAYGALVNELAAAPGEGVGVIHVDPRSYLYLQDAGVLVEKDGRLYDRLGNLVVVRRNIAPDTLYAEAEWRAAIYLSDYILLPDASDSVSTATNAKIYRVERGAIIQREACSTFSIEYSC